MNKKIGEKIRIIRSSRGYSQANMAEELGISAGGYAKIERGETDANASRLLQIARILEVNVAEFFEDTGTIKEYKNNYGYATKEEVEHLSKMVYNLVREVDKIRAELPQLSLKSKSRFKKAKK